jgi:hypothetical protein
MLESMLSFVNRLAAKLRQEGGHPQIWVLLRCSSDRTSRFPREVGDVREPGVDGIWTL